MKRDFSLLEQMPGCEKRCPGCRHRALTRQESETSKFEWVRKNLAPLLEEPGILEPVQGADEPERWAYRNKVCLRARWDGSEKRWKLGLRVFTRVPDSFDRIEEVIDIPDCPIHSSRVRAIHQKLAGILPSSAFLPLIYVLISGTLVTLVLKTARSRELENWSRHEDVEKSLREVGVQGLFLNFNASAGERVLSQRGWFHAWGAEMTQDSEGFWYGPDSFRQLLPSLHQQSLLQAARFFELRANDQVIDLYSGSGASMRLWEKTGARAIGVELGGEAVACADKNLGPGKVIRGRTSERLPQLESWLAARGGPADDGRRLLFANPPRAGIEEEVTHWIARELRPEKLAYLSCSVATLARDLSILQNSGYALRKAVSYDFFPGTHHVEVLALVERLS